MPFVAHEFIRGGFGVDQPSVKNVVWASPPVILCAVRRAIARAYFTNRYLTSVQSASSPSYQWIFLPSSTVLA